MPIKSIERSYVVFNHWFVDIAGPYSLIKRWNIINVLSVVITKLDGQWPLPVNSKSIVECLLKMWSTFGVSQFVSMDNAAYNTSKLTKLLMEKMGCSPIFTTPGHSAGNFLAKRTLGTIKELIHKMVYEHKKSWWKSQDYVLWAMREIPHRCLNIYWNYVLN